VASEFRWRQDGDGATCNYHGLRLEAYSFGWSITRPDGTAKSGAVSVSSYSSNQTRLAANKAAAEGAAFREVHKRG